MKYKESQAWSLYWESANLHSCLASSGEEDQKLLEQQWYEFAETLATTARVLDLATGNGAVPYALLSRCSELHIDAVDYADIQPTKRLNQSALLNKVVFHPNTDINSLSEMEFEENGFDALTSQFGIEYAGLNSVLSKCIKLIKPGGRVKLIVHHTDSELLISSRRKLEELNHLLADQGLVESLVLWSKGQIEFHVLEVSGKDNIKNCPNRSLHVSGQVFDGINKILSMAQSRPHEGVLLAETMRTRMLAEQERLRQLDAAAVAQDELFALESLFTEAGFGKIRTNTIELEPQGYLLAWNIEAEKQ